MADKKSFLRLEKGRVESYDEYDEIPLCAYITVIGRSPGRSETDLRHPDIEIRDDFISRSHLSITYIESEDVYIMQERDGGTRNGTFLNEERIQPGKTYPLKDGDLIGLAKSGRDYRVSLRFRETQATLEEHEVFDATRERLVVSTVARRVWVEGTEVSLRKKEYDLLAFLYENRGKACSREDISRTVWAEESGIISEETIDSTVHRLREKIEADPSNPRYIITLPRYGYRLDL
jgi:hypothetical protein